MRARWKRVSDKKLSARERASFIDKRHQTARILSSGGTLPLPSGPVRGHEPSVLPCIFSDNVLCSYRKEEGSYVMGRCFKCPAHERFEREMDKEDKETMDEFDEIRRSGVY
jgi:hypothetical protein